MDLLELRKEIDKIDRTYTFIIVENGSFKKSRSI